MVEATLAGDFVPDFKKFGSWHDIFSAAALHLALLSPPFVAPMALLR
jgi:hypothetical protein